MDRKFEGDEARRLWSIEKQRIDFVRANFFFEGHVVLIVPRFRSEERYLAISMRDGRCITVVSTRRGSSIRLISARRSRNGGKRAYRSFLEQWAR